MTCLGNATQSAGPNLWPRLAGLAVPADIARAGVPCPGYENLVFCAALTSDCKVTANNALVALRMSIGQFAYRLEADLDGSKAVTAAGALSSHRRVPICRQTPFNPVCWVAPSSSSPSG